MKKPLTFLASLVFMFVAVASQSAEIVPDLALHESVSLDGEWQIIVDPYETGFYDYRYRQRDQTGNPSRSETFYLDVKPQGPSDFVEYDFDRSPSLTVPGDRNTQRPDLFYYEGTVWYRRKFEIAESDGTGKTFLRFGAANYRADVYLNGSELGTHFGGFTPFSFEITESLKRGTNSLVVKVDNKRHKSNVPTLNSDWWNYGGLTRSMALVRTPDSFIAEHRLWLDSEDQEVILGSATIAGANAGEAVELAIPELGVQLVEKTNDRGVATFRANVENLQRWSPERPKRTWTSNRLRRQNCSQVGSFSRLLGYLSRTLPELTRPSIAIRCLLGRQCNAYSIQLARVTWLPKWTDELSNWGLWPLLSRSLKVSDIRSTNNREPVGFATTDFESSTMLTVNDVSNRLRVSRTCVYQLVERGKLACHRIGLGRGAIRISLDDLVQFVEGCRVSKIAEVPSSAICGRRLKHLRQ